jgi:hypothetical protein
MKDAMSLVVKSARHTHAVVASNPAGNSDGLFWNVVTFFGFLFG